MKNSNNKNFYREFMVGENEQRDIMNLLLREMKTFPGIPLSKLRKTNQDGTASCAPKYSLFLIKFIEKRRIYVRY